MRLPTLHQLDSLVQLAAHDRPDVRAQADELCRALPGAVRVLAAARLAERGAFLAAVRCAWPEHPEEAEALSRAVVRDCAEHILPRWLTHTDGSDALQQALARAPRTRTRGIRRALEETVRSHPYRTVYAMAVLGMALLEEDPSAGIAACTDHLPLACERPEGARPWMAARMRHHLARQRPLSLADRRGLARAFAEALDDDDVARAGLLLTGGCAYVLRDNILHGPEAILASYADNSTQAHTRFEAVAYRSRVGAVDEESAVLHFEDVLTLRGRQHVFACQQRIWMDDLGAIWRIEHEDLPGQRAALAAFEAG